MALSCQGRKYVYNSIVMKKDIHPPYYPKAQIKCACGKAWHIGSTKEVLETEVCSNCHPFYTGKGKLIDTAGRIEKFRARKIKAEAITRVTGKKNKVAKKAKKTK